MLIAAQVFLLLVMAVVLFWMCLVFISGLISNFRGAPYVPMKKGLVRELLYFGELSPNDIFYDLGSGNGQFLISAIRDFNVQKAIGYEISPWPFLVSKWKTGNLKNIVVLRENFLKADLSEATFVYAYLFPKLIDRLASKLEKELKPGTKVLCSSFPIDVSRYPHFLLKKEAKIGNINAYLYHKI